MKIKFLYLSKSVCSVAVFWSDFVFQVNELYELMKKWESVGDSLPQVVDRMVALQDLHQQGTKKTIK
jgi:hypothetical protein